MSSGEIVRRWLHTWLNWLLSIELSRQPWNVERENTIHAFAKYLNAKALSWQCTLEELDIVKHAEVSDYLVEEYWTAKELTGIANYTSSR